MDKVKQIFKNQLFHLLSLAILLLIVHSCLTNCSEILNGSLLGISTKTWLLLAIAVPIVHQIYVWLIWRLELYNRTFTKRFGINRAFNIYAIGFTILFVSRLLSIIALASSNNNTLHIKPVFSYTLAAIITPFIIYLFYSVKKYFTVKRAYGIDHFDKNYNLPFEKKGIFKYTDNGMYVVGLLILYLPGLLLFSKAAILAAIFNHAYIWSHYYFTERPDMQKIYGNAP